MSNVVWFNFRFLLSDRTLQVFAFRIPLSINHQLKPPDKPLNPLLLSDFLFSFWSHISGLTSQVSPSAFRFVFAFHQPSTQNDQLTPPLAFLTVKDAKYTNRQISSLRSPILVGRVALRPPTFRSHVSDFYSAFRFSLSGLRSPHSGFHIYLPFQPSFILRQQPVAIILPGVFDGTFFVGGFAQALAKLRITSHF